MENKDVLKKIIIKGAKKSFVLTFSPLMVNILFKTFMQFESNSKIYKQKIIKFLLFHSFQIIHRTSTY